MKVGEILNEEEFSFHSGREYRLELENDGDNSFPDWLEDVIAKKLGMREWYNKGDRIYFELKEKRPVADIKKDIDALVDKSGMEEWFEENWTTPNLDRLIDKDGPGADEIAKKMASRKKPPLSKMLGIKVYNVKADQKAWKEFFKSGRHLAGGDGPEPQD